MPDGFNQVLHSLEAAPARLAGFQRPQRQIEVEIAKASGAQGLDRCWRIIKVAAQNLDAASFHTL